VVAGISADDDAVRFHEIFDRRPLLEELRVADHAERLTRVRANRVVDFLRRPDRNSALVDDDRVMRHRTTDIPSDRQHVLEVSRAVLALGSPNRDKDDFGRLNGRFEVRGERQPLFLLVSPDQLFKSRLVNRHLAGPKRRDFRFVLVDTNDGVSVFRQARTQHKSHVPGPHHGNFHFTIRY
jgi:hypothetical protein